MVWWAPHVLKKRDPIIAKNISRSVKSNMKYGIRVPKSAREALNLDEENKNNLRSNAIMTEMKNNRVAFDILEEHQNVGPGRKYIECFMRFEIKMDFRRKARYVANG